jgi:abortive infection Abi-like protein
MPLAPSVRTRQLFREFLVGTVLRYIDDVFTGAGIKQGTVLPERLPSGQRRSLVEEYYAGIDWNSSRDVAKLLRAFEHVLFDAADSDEKQRLVKALRLDGFVVDDAGRINPPASLDLGIDRDSLVDAEAFAGYERRILENVGSDPELAIGSSKELVEAVCKLLLEDAGIDLDTSWTAEQLFKQALKTLDLSVDEVPESKAGAESIKKVLRGMHQAVIGTAELRNRFGTGHGRHRRSSGLEARHARLVAGAALGLSRFLLDTRAEKTKRDPAGNGAT